MTDHTSDHNRNLTTFKKPGIFSSHNGMKLKMTRDYYEQFMPTGKLDDINKLLETNNKN